jgi:hypothetical protein
VITKKPFVVFAWSVAMLVCHFTSAQADIISTFDADNEGWTTFQNAGAPVTFHATGGNPGGYVSVIDQSNDWGYVQAPSKFLVPAIYGGSFSFDLRASTSDSINYPIQFSVRAALVGNGMTLINELGIPDGTWTNYSFTLNELAGWRVFSNLNQNYSPGAPKPTQSEMQGVLANPSGLFIAADYTNGTTLQNVTEETHLDNIRLSAVPEPSSAVLIVIAAAGFWLVRRQRVFLPHVSA